MAEVRKVRKVKRAVSDESGLLWKEEQLEFGGMSSPKGPGVGRGPDPPPHEPVEECATTKGGGLEPPATGRFPPPAVFHELPSRRHVEIAVDDPCFGSDDYDAWASVQDVQDAIVRVRVTLSEASNFSPATAAEVLRKRGAFSVLPIVPVLPKQQSALLAPPKSVDVVREPVDVAFERFLNSRPLPKGVTKEQVLAAFQEARTL